MPASASRAGPKRLWLVTTIDFDELVALAVETGRESAESEPVKSTPLSRRRRAEKRPPAVKTDGPE